MLKNLMGLFLLLWGNLAFSQITFVPDKTRVDLRALDVFEKLRQDEMKASFWNDYPPHVLSQVRQYLERELQKELKEKQLICYLSEVDCIVSFFKLLRLEDLAKSKQLEKVSGLVIYDEKKVYRNFLYIDYRLKFRYLKAFMGRKERSLKHQVFATLNSSLGVYQVFKGMQIEGKKKLALEKLGPLHCEKSNALYDKLFKNQEIRATWVKGFFDTPTEEDGHDYSQANPAREYQQFLHGIKVLKDQYFFKVKEKTATKAVLYRDFVYKGKIKTLRLVFARSLVGCKDSKTGKLLPYNKNKTCKEQDLASKEAKTTFVKGLEKDDIVLYSGHARYGWGPDFGRFDKLQYKVQVRYGALKKMKNSELDVLYLNACSSSKHFTKAVKEDVKAEQLYPFLYIGNSTASYLNKNKVDLSFFMSLIQGRCMSYMKQTMDLERYHHDKGHTQTFVF